MIAAGCHVKVIAEQMAATELEAHVSAQRPIALWMDVG
jgi:hypothetical protein